VLEALAMKRAVVASPQALAALRVRPGVELLTAADAGEWTDSILRLFDDSALRGRLGEAGRAYVEANHDWDACLQPLGRLLKLDEPARTPANGRSAPVCLAAR
jgi:glycosyltransferase involved in cell wall biosynthesis